MSKKTVTMDTIVDGETLAYMAKEHGTTIDDCGREYVLSQDVYPIGAPYRYRADAYRLGDVYDDEDDDNDIREYSLTWYPSEGWEEYEDEQIAQGREVEPDADACDWGHVDRVERI
jgi:hypothetical protein